MIMHFHVGAVRKRNVKKHDVVVCCFNGFVDFTDKNDLCLVIDVDAGKELIKIFNLKKSLIVDGFWFVENFGPIC